MTRLAAVFGFTMLAVSCSLPGSISRLVPVDTDQFARSFIDTLESRPAREAMPFLVPQLAANDAVTDSLAMLQHVLPKGLPDSRCAQSCFATYVTASTPAYYSLNAARNVTLVYNGDRLRARPFVYADVVAGGDSLPHNYLMQVTSSAGAKLKFTNGDTVLTFAGGSGGRLAGQLALDSTVATSPMAITVTTTAVYSTGPQSQSTPLVIAAVNERNSPIAHGWTLLGIQHLYPQSSDNAVLITEGDGSAEVWTNCSGTVSCGTTPVGEYSNLTWSGTFPGSSYLRTYPDSSKATFNSSGQLIKLADAFGNNDSMAYDVSGRLTAVYDPIRTNNGSGRAAISLSYGSTYGLASITSPGANGSLTGGRTTTFRVNASDSTLTTVIDPDGDSTMFGYDAKKRLSWVRDRRGDTTKYSYDTLSYKLTGITTPPVSIDSGNGRNWPSQSTLKTTYVPWQTQGVPTSHTSTSSPAPLGSLSPQLRVIGPAGNDTSLMTVNRWGQALTIINALHGEATVTIVDTNLDLTRFVDR